MDILKPIEITELPAYTLQEIFDWVTFQMLRQGRKSIDEKNSCVYRNESGLKCAAGHCITDQEYTNLKEEGIFAEWMSAPKFLGDLYRGDEPEIHIQFIYALQQLHDTTETKNWKSALNSLALKWGLNNKILDIV